MIKRLSRIFVILTLIFTLSFSMVACNEGSTSTGDDALAEFVPTDAYQGTHDLTYEDSANAWLVQGGVSEFQLIFPSVLSTDMKVAKEEFDMLFFDATGLSLPSVADYSAISVDGLYISFGNNSWFKSMNKNPGDEGYDPEIHISDAEIDLENLKTEGVRIITKKNITYFLGNTDTAVVNCVYTFMNIHFNFEYFYRDTITIDTNVIDEKAKVFNVKDIPDIDRRVRNIPTYDIVGNSFPYDLVNGLEAGDIKNRSYRARLTAGHGIDMMNVLHADKWGGPGGSGGLIHNVEEYYIGYKNNITNINDTRYVNIEKYYYDEYIPSSTLYTDTGAIQYDPYAVGRLGNPDAVAYVADVDGDGIVDVDEDGNGIPDSWGAWGNGISDELKAVDKDGNGIGDWYEYGDQKEHEVAGEGYSKGVFGDMWQGVSVCYTAHGNENAYQALVKRLAECVIQSCAAQPVSKYPHKNTMQFSMEDAGEPCTCAACKADFTENDESYCGAVNKLLNDVMEQYVLPWMAKPENAEYDRRHLGFTMGYFVYHNLTNAPVWQDENGVSHWDEADDCLGYEYVKDAQGNIDWTKTKERWNVSIYFAGGYRANENNWYDNSNDKARHCMDEWKMICQDFYIWDYPSYQYGWAYFMDTVALHGNDYYQMLASIGTKFVFAESCDSGDIAQDWQTLNSYVQQNLMWDSTRPAGELTKKFFDAMYLDASDTMFEAYTAMRVYKQYMKDAFNIRTGAGGSQMGQAKYWPLAILQSWTNTIYSAIDEIAKYETINYGLYLQVRDHIHIELVTPVMMIMSFYRESITPADYAKYKEFMLYYSDLYTHLECKAGSETSFHVLASKL